MLLKELKKSQCISISKESVIEVTYFGKCKSYSYCYC